MDFGNQLSAVSTDGSQTFPRLQMRFRRTPERCRSFSRRAALVGSMWPVMNRYVTMLLVCRDGEAANLSSNVFCFSCDVRAIARLGRSPNALATVLSSYRFLATQMHVPSLIFQALGTEICAYYKHNFEIWMLLHERWKLFVSRHCLGEASCAESSFPRVPL